MIEIQCVCMSNTLYTIDKYHVYVEHCVSVLILVRIQCVYAVNFWCNSMRDSRAFRIQVMELSSQVMELSSQVMELSSQFKDDPISCRIGYCDKV